MMTAPTVGLSLLLVAMLGLSSPGDGGVEVASGWNLFCCSVRMHHIQGSFVGSLLVISSAILYYGWFYMGGGSLALFWSVLLVFVVSMATLICHDGLFPLVVGWDGLGASSFLLVQHYGSWSALSGALVTLMTNRIGDACVFFFFGASLVCGGELFMVLALSMVPQMFLLIGSCTKSAQVPFVGWLPLAMSAPTPVSSLVHSSTLVTAGVYLMLRYFTLLSSVSLCFLFSLGLTTSLIAGMGAVVESDTKKVVALSTLSQLGLLTLALGSSLPILSFCHLLSHAFLKSCLFLQVGVDIKGGFSTQSGDGWAGSKVPMPSHPVLVGGSLWSLCGLSYLSGFFSKDAIVSGLICSGGSSWLTTTVILSVCLTFLYSAKIWREVMASGGSRVSAVSQDVCVIAPSTVLFTGGVVVGWVTQWNLLPVPAVGAHEEKIAPLVPLVIWLATLLIPSSRGGGVWRTSLFGLGALAEVAGMGGRKQLSQIECLTSPQLYPGQWAWQGLSSTAVHPWGGVTLLLSLIIVVLMLL